MIFVDTSFWTAFHNRRDSRHDSAVHLFARHQAEPLMTTNLVRGETWTLLRRRQGHSFAVDFVDALERSPRILVDHVTESLERDALTWLRRHDERMYSFVDAASFISMGARRVREALAFDGDFSAAGFVELRAG